MGIMFFRDYNPETDEPVNGWSGEMIRDALSRGESLVVDQNGDVWTLDDAGDTSEYCGRIRRD